MSPEELADYLIFEAGGFDLDAKTQDGGTARERMSQDHTQKVCSALARSGKDLDRVTAAKISALADDSIQYPEGGVELGDWQRGEEIARSGYGYRIGHHGTLTQAQIADVMAYLLDPDSPVSQEPPQTANAEQTADD